MKLYVLVSDNPNDWAFYHKAYTNREMAEFTAYNTSYHVREIELPFIGKHVCYVHAYYGYTYDWPDMHGVYEDSGIYACMRDANEDPIWKKAINRVKAEGEEKYALGFGERSEPYIRSKLSGGYEWFHGEACDGNFFAKIFRVKVIKQTYEQYRYEKDKELAKFLRECGY